jgi:hypothetical protein
MTEDHQPHVEKLESHYRGLMTDIALVVGGGVAGGAVNGAANGATQAIVSSLLNRPQKEQPPEIVLPPGVSTGDPRDD